MCATILLAITVACAGACASHGSKESEGGTSSDASRTSDVITAQQLAEPSVRGGNLLDVIRRLRPRFLTVRGVGSIRVADAGAVHVSVDGGPLMAVSMLSNMRPGEVAEIRYLEPPQAAQRFGTASASGSVILVKTK
jgi:hypothetical protein